MTVTEQFLVLRMGQATSASSGTRSPVPGEPVEGCSKHGEMIQKKVADSSRKSCLEYVPMNFMIVIPLKSMIFWKNICCFHTPSSDPFKSSIQVTGSKYPKKHILKDSNASVQIVGQNHASKITHSHPRSKPPIRIIQKRE